MESQCTFVHLGCSYNATIWGPSGNITINGTLTFGNDSAHNVDIHTKRGLGMAGEFGVDLNNPPYSIHNGWFISA